MKQPSLKETTLNDLREQYFDLLSKHEELLRQYQLSSADLRDLQALLLRNGVDLKAEKQPKRNSKAESVTTAMNGSRPSPLREAIISAFKGKSNMKRIELLEVLNERKVKFTANGVDAALKVLQGMNLVRKEGYGEYSFVGVSA